MPCRRGFCPMRPFVSDPFPVESVELEFALVVLPEHGVLLFLLEKAVTHGERFNLGTHETAERVLGRAHNRLPAHVEAGIDDHWTARTTLEAADERVIAGVRFAVHRLDARG